MKNITENKSIFCLSNAKKHYDTKSLDKILQCCKSTNQYHLRQELYNTHRIEKVIQNIIKKENKRKSKYFIILFFLIALSQQRIKNMKKNKYLKEDIFFINIFF